MQPTKEIPELTKELFEKWADEIIRNNQLTSETALEVVLEKIAEFFNILFEDYEISFVDLHPDGIFPFSFEKRGGKKASYGDEKFWVDEVFKVENHLHWTYVYVLTKLNRNKECPNNTLDCPY